MIQVIIKTNTVRDRRVTAELSTTPKSVFESEGIDVAGSMVNLDGAVLTAADLNTTFEALGAKTGGVVRLNSVVKMDGGSR